MILLKIDQKCVCHILQFGDIEVLHKNMNHDFFVAGCDNKWDTEYLKIVWDVYSSCVIN